MMLFRLFKCPYIGECGPDKQWISYGHEMSLAEKQCYTGRHNKCEEFMGRRQRELLKDCEGLAELSLGEYLKTRFNRFIRRLD